jgi:hypothetical protein
VIVPFFDNESWLQLKNGGIIEFFVGVIFIF